MDDAPAITLIMVSSTGAISRKSDLMIWVRITYWSRVWLKIIAENHRVDSHSWVLNNVGYLLPEGSMIIFATYILADFSGVKYVPTMTDLGELFQQGIWWATSTWYVLRALYKMLAHGSKYWTLSAVKKHCTDKNHSFDLASCLDRWTSIQIVEKHLQGNSCGW